MGIPKERRVRYKESGIAQIPKWRVIAQADLGQQEAVSQNSKPLYGEARHPAHVPGELPHEHAGAPVADNPDKIPAVRVEPAKTGRVFLTSWVGVGKAYHLQGNHRLHLCPLCLELASEVGASDHVELFQIESAEKDLSAEFGAGENTRCLEKDGHTARIVVGSRASLHRVEMSSYYYQTLTLVRSPTGRGMWVRACSSDDVAVACSPMREGVAFNAEPVALKLALDVGFDRGEMVPAAEGAPLPDDLLEVSPQGCGIHSGKGGDHECVRRTAMPLSWR